MPAEQQPEQLEMFRKHRWPKICKRLNVVHLEFRQQKSQDGDRKKTIECKSQSFSANNKSMRHIYAKILQMLPQDFERGKTS